MVTASSSIRRTAVWFVTALVLGYSASHFFASGIRFPLEHPNLGKFEEEALPLRTYLATGQPAHSSNLAQYGPVFFFVMHPLLRATQDEQTLANLLYAIQILCIVGSFLLTCATLKPIVVEHHPEEWPLAVAWMAAIWLNFSPLHTILALKSVETWELLLFTLGLYAHLRGHLWTAAIAVAAAGLIKMLPFVFLYYWLITDRRTFAYACAAVAAFLLAGHLVYGPEMGLRYLPAVVTNAAGDSYGLTWHENISLKAALAKAFGRLPSGYYGILEGWRKTAVVTLGDVAMLGGFATLTWTWVRAGAARDRARTLWEWSVLAVVLLILSPNTIFEYATLALGAISYALARLLVVKRPGPRVAFFLSLFLLGDVVPRSWLNRLTLVDALNRWTGHTHLKASEAYQYYCFPLIGLVLLTYTVWQLQPAASPSSRA